MSFEENLLDFQEAELIRREHTFEGLSMHQLAFKHGIPFQTIKNILYFKIFKPDVPAETGSIQKKHRF